MKPLFLVIAFFFLTDFAQAVSHLQVKIGERDTEALALQQRKVSKKNLHILGFRSPRKGHFVQTVPKDMYQNSISKFLKIEKDISRSSPIKPLQMCQQKMEVKKDKALKTVCLDRMNAKNRNALNKWFDEHRRVATGVY